MNSNVGEPLGVQKIKQIDDDDAWNTHAFLCPQMVQAGAEDALEASSTWATPFALASRSMCWRHGRNKDPICHMSGFLFQVSCATVSMCWPWTNHPSVGGKEYDCTSFFHPKSAADVSSFLKSNAKTAAKQIYDNAC